MRRCCGRPDCLTRGELRAIIRGLEAIGKEIKAGKFRWQAELEDVHMNIEAALTRRVPAGAKLHTGRSRNDQVALDMRLWLREQIVELRKGDPAAAARAGRAGRAGARSGDPGLHAFAAGAAGLSGASPAGLRGDAGARLPAAAGMPGAGQRLPAGQRRAGRLDAAAGPRAGGRVARVCGCAGPAATDAELDGRRERPGFCGGVLQQRGAARRCTSRGWRKT